MNLVQDLGGEMQMQLDDFGSQATSSRPAAACPSYCEKTYIEESDVYDDDEGPDEKNESPALYLRKFWRLVSAEPLTFSCFRSPKCEFIMAL